MKENEPLNQGYFYHIYNHGVGGRNLFFTAKNYEYFLLLYDKYISPIAETYSWVLMKNHFHFLVRIKEDVIYKYSNADRSGDAVRFDEEKWKTIDPSACATPDSVYRREKQKTPEPENHLSHFFNAYTKAYNILYGTRGSLFERPFRRKQITNEKYLRQVILFIHNNPVHHGFCEHPSEYPWSSYLTCLSLKPTKLKRESVIGWFDDEANFRHMHKKRINVIEIEKWLDL